MFLLQGESMFKKLALASFVMLNIAQADYSVIASTVDVKPNPLVESIMQDLKAGKISQAQASKYIAAYIEFMAGLSR